jgi:hypothetical protein
MPIPKPLTDEIIDDIFRKVMNKHAYITEGLIELRREYARAVERAHGIGEKDDKAAQPDDDLNNVRYKANYRYETKNVLQRTYENAYNFTAVEMDWVVRGLFALHKQQPPEAAAIQQLINKLANTVYGIGEKDE